MTVTDGRTLLSTIDIALLVVIGGVVSIKKYYYYMNKYTFTLPNVISNGSLLPTALLNTTLSEHCSY